MKNLILIITVIFGGLFYGNSQEISENAIGLDLEIMMVLVEKFHTKKNWRLIRLEVDLGYRNHK